MTVAPGVYMVPVGKTGVGKRIKCHEGAPTHSLFPFLATSFAATSWPGLSLSLSLNVSISIKLSMCMSMSQWTIYNCLSFLLYGAKYSHATHHLMCPQRSGIGTWQTPCLPTPPATMPGAPLPRLLHCPASHSHVCHTPNSLPPSAQSIPRALMIQSAEVSPHCPLQPTPRACWYLQVTRWHNPVPLDSLAYH
mmetsp:Transcript_99940/g.172405  ORF Transcript_99940/g.172405 Transcript_99940/m.172405 type:complete len:193 (-) Transcript_99940:835-1413(-)